MLMSLVDMGFLLLLSIPSRSRLCTPLFLSLCFSPWWKEAVISSLWSDRCVRV
ncbi:unnamed protein product [Brassica rapa subsp. trilocularis]